MGENRKVLLITENFPYLPGEQFLEEEVAYWDKFYQGELVILPTHANGPPRNVPDRIKVSSDLTRRLSGLTKTWLFLRALLSVFFIKEIRYLISIRRLKAACFKTALKTTYDAFKLRLLLKGYLAKQPEKPIVYTYWFNTAFYAAALVKSENRIEKLISRAHRFDLYEDVKVNQYMPLKRQFLGQLDYLSVISAHGKAYLQEVFGITEDKIGVDRLGVEIPAVSSPASVSTELIVLSISYCSVVKNIHKIIEGMELAAKSRRELSFVWHHVGNGPVRNLMEDLAHKKVSWYNVSYTFHGNMDNADVRKFLATNSIDVFINTSQSEGIPVSIMEAMSYGVPAIGPDVGGVSEIINSDHGILLAPDPTIPQIAQALLSTDFLKNEKTRVSAKVFAKNFYHAESNYREFIYRLSHL